MDKIILSGVMPHVFTGQDALTSDVWQQEVVFERGKTYLVEADSGKGKSTFCSYLIGYRSDYDGDIRFDEALARSMTVGDWTLLRQRHIGYLFQELRLFPELSAWENVVVKNRLTGFATDDQLYAWFQRLGIADKKDELIARMSFGQQQRVAMIRALCQPFDFLLADEPISHLDDQNSEQMGLLMMEEAHRQGAAVIVTSIGKHMTLPYDQVLHL